MHEVSQGIYCKVCWSRLMIRVPGSCCMFWDLIQFVLLLADYFSESTEIMYVGFPSR